VSSIYEKITVKYIDPTTGKFITETLKKVQFLRMSSNGANMETDTEIQDLFDAFHI
jgi:hypothetical protein